MAAPFDDTIGTIFETGHAVSLTVGFGAEVLIHAGLDTVELKGQHYRVPARDGDKVKRGQLLIEFDVEAIQAAGYDVITPVVIRSGDEYRKILTHTGREVTRENPVLALTKAWAHPCFISLAAGRRHRPALLGLPARPRRDLAHPPLGIAAFAIFFLEFNFAIKKWDLKPPGRTRTPPPR